MLRLIARRSVPLALLVPLVFTAGCPMDMDGDGDDFVPLFALETFATNTAGASAIAVRPSDGAVFIVNSAGLFGPIEEGDDVSTLTPFGAENLDDADLFDTPQTDFALAITNDGEFWIGSSCCGTLAIVPPTGGDAEPFEGLLAPPVDAVNSLNIFPDALVLVPANGGGDEFAPGNLLATFANDFSRLAAIDVDGNRDVVSVDNPIGNTTDRHGNFMAFDGEGNLFAADDNTGVTQRGLQQIDPDGTPVFITNSEGVSATAFVIDDNNDFIIRGALAQSGGSSFRGLLLLDSASGDIVRGLEIADSAASISDDMVLLPDGTILMTQPRLNRIVRIVPL